MVPNFNARNELSSTLVHRNMKISWQRKMLRSHLEGSGLVKLLVLIQSVALV